jgi:hypothetical protein
MRTRSAALGGVFDVTPGAGGRGTRIRIRMPLAAHNSVEPPTRSL